MTNARSLWDDDPEPSVTLLTPDPARASRERRRVTRYPRRYDGGISTDIIEWLNQNEPADFAELMDLRKALYSHKTKGKYRIELLGFTSEGELKLSLTGPASAVLILSNKARHFLLRNLCRLRRARRWPPIKYR